MLFGFPARGKTLSVILPGQQNLDSKRTESVVSLLSFSLILFCYAVLCNAMLCNVIHCYAMLCYASWIEPL